MLPTVYTAYPRKCAMVRCHLANWRVADVYEEVERERREAEERPAGHV